MSEHHGHRDDTMTGDPAQRTADTGSVERTTIRDGSRARNTTQNAPRTTRNTHAQGGCRGNGGAPRAGPGAAPSRNTTTRKPGRTVTQHDDTEAGQAGQSRAGRAGRAGQSRQGRAGTNRTEPNRTEQNRTEPTHTQTPQRTTTTTPRDNTTNHHATPRQHPESAKRARGTSRGFGGVSGADFFRAAAIRSMTATAGPCGMPDGSRGGEGRSPTRTRGPGRHDGDRRARAALGRGELEQVGPYRLQLVAAGVQDRGGGQPVESRRLEHLSGDGEGEVEVVVLLHAEGDEGLAGLGWPGGGAACAAPRRSLTGCAGRAGGVSPCRLAWVPIPSRVGSSATNRSSPGRGDDR